MFHVKLEGSLATGLLGATLCLGGEVFVPEKRWERLTPIPNAQGLGGPYAGVSGGRLLVAGGANFPGAMPWAGGKKRWYDTIYALAEPQGHWEEVGKLPRPMGYGVCGTTAEGMICAGGSDLERHYPDTFLLRWKSGKLVTQPLPPMPAPMANGCGAVLGSTLYVAGGLSSPTSTNALRAFWALDLAEARPVWRELEPWPGPARMLAVAAAAGGAFYLFSGTDLSGDAAGKPVRHYLRDAYCYRPGAGWQKLADVPRPALAAPSPAPVWAETHILVLSGDNGTKIDFQPLDQHPGFPRDILSYDIARNTWSVAGQVRATQVTVPTALWRGRWVIPNGEIRPGVRTAEVWSLPATKAEAAKQ